MIQSCFDKLWNEVVGNAAITATVLAIGAALQVRDNLKYKLGESSRGVHLVSVHKISVKYKRYKTRNRQGPCRRLFCLLVFNARVAIFQLYSGNEHEVDNKKIIK